MPNSQHDPIPGIEDVRTYLQSLPESRVTSETINSSYSPLLLLQRVNFVAGFGFANGDLRDSYNCLYSGFKAQFYEQRNRWTDFDLAFIFCVKPETSDLDVFCSHVETDVLFCRKFVVPLILPVDEALARLPFLPLERVHGASFRPPTAQTLLQQAGVPAELSRFIVIQRERSPEGIVDDCVSGRFGAVKELQSNAISPRATVDEAARPVRARSVTIKNFRAYRKEQTFKLDADVTVLYGPNGFGKTSVFDAVDFAITGGIARFDSFNAARFTKTARHLDSGSEEGVVSLVFEAEGKLRKIARTVSDRKSATFDGNQMDRKGVLSELTKANTPAADRIENFVRLFRATHFFSQEQQELTRGFEDTCTLSEEVVSRMLAFEDYVSAVNKGSRVLEILRKEIANAEQQNKVTTSLIAGDREELKRLGPSKPSELASSSLAAELSSLQKRLKEARVSGLKDNPDVMTLRSWRASVESRRAECQQRIERYSALAMEAKNLPTMKQVIVKTQQEITTVEKSIAEAETERAVAETALNELQVRMASLVAQRGQLERREAILGWVHTTKPEFEKRSVALRKTAKVLGEVTVRQSAMVQEETKTEAELRAAEDRAAHLDQRVREGRARLQSLEAIRLAADTCDAQRKELATILEQQRAAENELEQLGTQYAGLSDEVAAKADREAILSLQIDEVDRTQSELRQLISQLHTYIEGGSCPLCGHEYQSRDELLKNIEAHIAADRASSARSELVDVQSARKVLEGRRTDVGRQRQQAEREKSRLVTTERSLRVAIDRFGNSVEAFGISRDLTGQPVADKLESQRNSLRLALDSLEKEAADAEATVRSTEERLSAAKKNTAAIAIELATMEGTRTQQEQEVRKLSEDTRAAEIPLNIEIQKVNEWIRTNTETLTQVTTDIAGAETAVKLNKGSAMQHRQRIDTLKGQLTRLQSRHAEAEVALAGIMARFAEAGIDQEATAESIMSLVQQESSRQASLLSLRDSVANLEMALDASTTAAAHTRLLEQIRGREKQVENARLVRSQHGQWAKFFEQVVHLLTTQQSDAISSFTREYGPRASVLQQRLRAVYGFDEIEIVSRQSEIEVRVKRNGERLRPTDYFSQSQQQTLRLGLFLTACLSQTWSSLVPIFLDDPITHFDDLNGYSFLDLILGLLESRIGQHQFIISTCDEKLLQLARQKFRHIGKRARFYNFSAVGSEGPVVAEIAVNN